MANIVLNPLASISNTSLVNDNFQKIEDAINSNVLHASGGNNTMSQELDMNGQKVINIHVDPTDGNSLANVYMVNNEAATRASADAGLDVRVSSIELNTLPEVTAQANLAAASASEAAASAADSAASVGALSTALASSIPGNGTDLVYDAAKASAVATALGNAAGFQQSGTGAGLRHGDQ